MGNRDKVEQWILGPKFLWEPEDTWNTNTNTPAINPEDPELKKGCACESDGCEYKCFVSSGKSFLNLVQNGQNCCIDDAVCKEIED